MSLNTTSSYNQHLYSDATGTYAIHRLFEWVNKNPQKHKEIPLSHLFEYIVHDTWSDFQTLATTNFKTVFENPAHQRRMKQADLSYPIIVSNFNKLIDGVHRIFRSIFDKRETIKTIFVDQTLLNTVRIGQQRIIPPQIIEGVAFPDQYLYLPEERIPDSPEQRRNLVEDYFPDFLPTAKKEGSTCEVCLERPSSPYGSYQHDPKIREGLSWWRDGTRIRDIQKEYRLLTEGILAVEEQWIPLSWSLAFQRLGGIPDELVVLHIDDHKDMMDPRLGKRLDGEMVDYITGDHVDFMDSESVRKAIISGAIGKGSIMTPLLWAVPRLHIRHLTFRPNPNTTYHLDKVTYKDGVLFDTPTRLGIHYSETSWENLQQKSNYVSTPSPRVWLKDIPKGVPILLHYDLDYFNNRFDGNSAWDTEEVARIHNPRFSTQANYLSAITKALSSNKLEDRIIDTSIGISPGFFPAEFWQKMVDEIFTKMSSIGIDLLYQEETTMAASIASNTQTVGIEADRVPRVRAREKPPKEKSVKKRRLSEMTPITVSSTDISVKKMAAQQFEGWKIQYQNKPAGYVKFIPKIDTVFQKCVTVDFKVPAKLRGKHIGRIALNLAIASSSYKLFVAHLRKSNIASKKALEAAGFQKYDYPESKQLCLVFRK